MRILRSSVRKHLRRTAAHFLIGVQAVAFAASAGGAPVVPAVDNQPLAKHLVMLYRKETDSSPSRLDPTVQATTLALEHEFLSRQYQIAQPSAEAYRAMDQGPGVIVTFAPAPAMSTVYPVYATIPPQPRPTTAIA